jgi:hypothetical protein
MLLGLYVSLLFGYAVFAEPLAAITVKAGRRTRIDTPVCVSLSGVSYDSEDLAPELREITDANRHQVAAQIEPGNPPRLWLILAGTTPAGTERVFHLSFSGSMEEKSIRVSESNEAIEIVRGDTRVLRYNYAVVAGPEGSSALCARSGFIHPLWSPAGTILTEIHPPHHNHHMGFWNLGEGQGTVRFREFKQKCSGPVYGGFVAEHEHVDLTAPEGEKTILNETWAVRVYDVGGPDKGCWLWDLVSTQRCATESPLQQLQHRYGGFGFRATRDWNAENSEYLTSEGKTRKDGHGTRARWCDISGKTGATWTGVTVMSHPQNFRHPEPMRIWPPESKYVFFGFAPSQLGDWQMAPGKDYVFRYRFFVHEGKPHVEQIERLWYDFAEPPEVTIVGWQKASRMQQD